MVVPLRCCTSIAAFSSSAQTLLVDDLSIYRRNVDLQFQVAGCAGFGSVEVILASRRYFMPPDIAMNKK